MPSVFVRGPSVGTPNFGSPAQFISGIQDTLQGFGDRRIAAEKVEADKLFRDQTLAQADRKQTFLEGADSRARAEKLFTDQQDNKRALQTLDIISGSGGSFKEPFLSNPETQAVFAAQGITDPAEQSRIVDQLAKDKKSLFNDPTKLGDQVYRKALEGGQTQAQADAARKQAIAGSFTTLPADLAKALIDKSGTPGGGFGKLFGGTKGKTGSAIQAAPAQQAEEELRDTITGRINIEDARGGGVVDTVANFFGIGDPTRSTWDFGQRDLDQGDIDRVVGNYGDKYPQHAIVGALRSIVDPDDGTIDQGKWQRILKDPESDNAKAFETEIQNWQKKAERTRGGQALSGLTATEIFNLGNQLQQAQDARNMNIIGRTAPQAADFASRLSALRGTFPGAAPATNNTRQGGNQGGAPVVTPEVVAPPQETAAGTGSSGLDSLLAPAAAPPVQEAEAAPPGRGDKLFAEATPIPIEEIKSPVLQAQLAEAQQRISIFGNGTPTDKKLIADTNKELADRQNEARIDEISTELQKMPRPDQRTLAQTAYARSLEKELRDLK